MRRAILILFGSMLTTAAMGQGSAGNLAIIDDVTAAARALLDSVRGDPEFSEVLQGFSMEDRLVLDFDDLARRDWSYWPRERVGLKLSLMHAKHRALTQELLWTLLSAKGYFKVLSVMQLENVLFAVSDTGFPRSVDNYVVAFFGEPSTEQPWALRFEGHHVSLSISIVPGQGISVTPTFLGADPAKVAFGPFAGVRVLRTEEDLGRALVRSLSGSERARAILTGNAEYNAEYGYTYDYDAPWDLISSTILRDPDKWEAWKALLKPDGIKVADLDAEQRDIVRRLVEEVVMIYEPEIASDYLSRIDVDELSFAWIGGLDAGEPHYYRLQGEDFLFEYDNVQGNGNHVHEVWHSRSGHLGEDLLKRHYEEAHR